VDALILDRLGRVCDFDQLARGLFRIAERPLARCISTGLMLAVMCGTWIRVFSMRWLSKTSPQGHLIRELGFCEGSFSPASHIAYFRAVQSADHATLKIGPGSVSKNTFHAVSKSARASSNVAAVSL